MAKVKQELEDSEEMLKRERQLRGLTQAFRESEEQRLQLTEKVRLTKAGAPLPGSQQAQLQEVQTLKQAVDDVLGGNAFQRLNKMVETIHAREPVVEALKQFSLEINDLSGASKNIDAAISSVNRQLQVLTDKVTADLDERRKLRLKLSATIDDLDKYLQNWL